MNHYGKIVFKMIDNKHTSMKVVTITKSIVDIFDIWFMVEPNN